MKGNNHKPKEAFAEHHLQLEGETTEKTANCLNELLSSYHLHYMNLRGFHWNVRGPRFFQLHVKFEEMYEQAAKAIDEVAERARMLGHTPMHSMTSYLEYSRIPEQLNVFKDTEAVGLTLDNLDTLVGQIRDLITRKWISEDAGTVDMLTGQLRYFEQMIWMLGAWKDE